MLLSTIKVKGNETAVGLRPGGNRRKMDKGKRRRNNPKCIAFELKNVNIIPATDATAI